MDPKNADRRELLKSALVRIDQLEKRLAAAEQRSQEPIAVIGLGCRFPGGSNDPASFWKLLCDGVDAITDIPADRWNVEQYYDPDPDAPGRMYVRGGGFVDDVDRFDPQFFGIAPREAPYMDPQQRLLLETSWSALEHAGIAPGSLVGSSTGVFLGLTTHDYARLQGSGDSFEFIDTYFGTGIAGSIAAGRVSYVLGLRGPAMTIDTACSSSLVAIHLACQSLRSGETRLSLAGGVNLILTPEGHVIASKGRMLAPDSRCKTFDRRADGYVRSEGCGMIVLKRLTDAIADGDPVLAVIRGTALNQDGRSAGMTAPNGRAQEDVMRQALADAGLAPRDVAYVETHGTGTSLGDPIEVQALDAVFGGDRTSETPLLIGSVKTNIGHLEAAAGVAGVIKTVLALRHGEIPPHLHFRDPNPYIPWAQMAVSVTADRRAWPAAVRRVAGVSSFGFSGTNAHLLLEAAASPTAPANATERPAHVLVLSGRTLPALIESAQRLKVALEASPPDSLADVCYTAATGRTHFEHRLATIGCDITEMTASLTAWLEGRRIPGQKTGEANLKRPPEVAFLFSGQGSQYANMGRGLFETQPVFREAIEKCAALLRTSVGRSLVEVLYPNPGDEAASEALLAHTGWTQPALFAFEYALAALWKSWGVQPAVVLGHSVGEFAAACVAGVLSLEDGLALIAERGRLMQALPEGGTMVAVPLDEATVAAAVAPREARVSIAAVNASSQTVVSGGRDDVAAVIAALRRPDLKTQVLSVSHAFHSPLIDSALDDFERFARTLSFHSPDVPLISNVTGEVVGESDVLDAGYWRRHARGTVRFASSLEAARRAGCTVFLEIGPHSTLTALGAGTDPAGAAEWIASLQRRHDDTRQMLSAASSLFVAGAPLDWSGFDRPYRRRKADLPAYPFQRERFWIEKAAVTAPVTLPAPVSEHVLLGRRLSSPALKQVVFERELTAEVLRAIRDHRIFGRVIVPAAAYLEIGSAVAASVLGTGSASVRALAIHEPIVLAQGATRTMQVVVDDIGSDAARFEIFSRPGSSTNESSAWQLHAAGSVCRVRGEKGNPSTARQPDRAVSQTVSGDEYYARLAAAGVEYGPSYRNIENVVRGDRWSSGLLHLSEAVLADDAGYDLHPAVLDACLQVLGLALPGTGSQDVADRVYLPVEVGEYTRVRAAEPQMRAECTVEASESGAHETFTGAVTLRTVTGELIAEVRDIRFKRASRAALLRTEARRLDDWMYQIDWEPLKPAAPTAAGGQWLVFADAQDVARRLAVDAGMRGAVFVLVQPGTRYVRPENGRGMLRPDAPQDFHDLLGDVADGGPLAGVLHLWNLDLDGEAGEDPSRARVFGTTSVLYLLQALAAQKTTSPPLTIVTRGAHVVADAALAGTSPLQAAVWGLGRVAATELPAQRIRLVDLDRAADESVAIEALSREVRVEDRTEQQVALRGADRFAPRLGRARQWTSGVSLRIPEVRPYGLEIRERGVLENLELRQIDVGAPGPGDVRIQVKTSGLNFRDVLNALGMYPGDPGHLGGEVVGIVDAVGAGVTSLTVGDPVLALTPRAFCSLVITSEKLAWKRPQALDQAAAATIPIVFLTAEYALRHVARLQAGERVLIHAGAGGVGLAAIQIAQGLGAEVFATAGSPRKREFLRAMGVRHVMDSRTLAFADQVMTATNGEGVDVVLNSLAGDFIPRSLSLLRVGGRFLEIGKTDLWDPQRALTVNPNASYFTVFLGDVCVTDPDRVQSMFGQLMARFERGELKPLPHRIWSVDRADEAFRFMAQAKHIGKIVIEQTSRAERTLVREGGAYLVTGAFGGLGLAVTRWLVDRGARHLTLIGRRAPDETARAVLRTLEDTTVTVTQVAADVADRSAMEQVFVDLDARGVPLRGVIHAAGILDDGLLLQQDATRFERVMRPKVDGAWNLDALTEGRELDFFALFSAGAGLFGAPGQGNYAAANTVLDALAGARRAAGRTAVSIDWGPWEEAGMAARLGARERERWAEQGMGLIPVAGGLAAMEWALRSDCAQVATLPIDWTRFLNVWPRGQEPALLRAIARDTPPAASSMAVEGDRILDALQSAPPEEQLAVLEAHVREHVARVLAIPEGSLRSDRGFAELGMDSLMSVELSNRLKRTLGRSLPTTLAFEYPTIEAVSAFLAQILGLGRAPAVVADLQEDEHRTRLLAEVDGLSDSEAEEDLARELDRAGY